VSLKNSFFISEHLQYVYTVIHSIQFKCIMQYTAGTKGILLTYVLYYMYMIN